MLDELWIYSLVTLSVSISAISSPAPTCSPSFFFHDAMLPASHRKSSSRGCISINGLTRILATPQPAYISTYMPTHPPDGRLEQHTTYRSCNQPAWKLHKLAGQCICYVKLQTTASRHYPCSVRDHRDNVKEACVQSQVDVGPSWPQLWFEHDRI